MHSKKVSFLDYFLKGIPYNKNINFTKREIEIIALLLTHKRNKEIAGDLNINIRTVESNFLNIYKKLGCSTRNQLKEKIEKSSLLIFFLSIQQDFFYRLKLRKLLINSNIDKTACILLPKIIKKYHKLITAELKNDISDRIKLRIIENPRDSSVDQVFITFDNNGIKETKSLTIISLHTSESSNKHNSIYHKVEHLYVYNEPLYSHILFKILENFLNKEQLNCIKKQTVNQFAFISQLPAENKKNSSRLLWITIATIVFCLFTVIYKKTSNKYICNDYQELFVLPDDFYDKLHSTELAVIKQKINNKFGVVGRIVNFLKDKTLKIVKNERINKKIIKIQLAGIAGIGKTTLVHYLANNYNGSVICELKCDNRQSLLNNIEKLGYKLSKFYNKQGMINILKNTNDSSIKFQISLKLIHKVLKNNKNWLIIMDNVDNYSTVADILDKFTVNNCGEGIIIITTRESYKSFSNRGFQYILLNFLATSQAIELFTFKHDSLNNRDGIYNKKITIIENEIKQIPLLPLDLIQSATYIQERKLANILTYVNLIKKDQEFNEYINNDSCGRRVLSRYLLSKHHLDSIRDEVDKNLLLECVCLFSCLHPDNMEKDLIAKYISFNNISIKNFNEIIKKFKRVFITTTHNSYVIHRLIADFFQQYCKKTDNKSFTSYRKKFLSFLFSSLNSLVSNHDILGIKELLIHVEYYCTNWEYSEIAESHLNLIAKSYFIVGKYEQAKKYANLSKGYYHSFLILGNVSLMYEHLDEAINFYQQGILMLEQQNGHESAKMVSFWGNLGEIYRLQGKSQQAKKLFKKAIKINDDNNIDPFNNVVWWGNLGELARSQKKYNLAKYYYNKALQNIRLKYPDPTFAHNATWLVALGIITRKEGKYEESARLLQEALKIRIKNFGNCYISNVSIYLNLAIIAENRNNFDIAEKYYRQAYKILNPYYTNNFHMKKTYVILNKLLKLLKKQHRFTVATEIKEIINKIPAQYQQNRYILEDESY